MTTSPSGITGGLALRSLVSEFEAADDLIETCRSFIPPMCNAISDLEGTNNQVFLEPVLSYSARPPLQDLSQQTSPTESSPRVYLDLDSHRNITSSTSYSPHLAHQNLQNSFSFSSAKSGPIQAVLYATIHAERHIPSKRKRVARRALFKPVSERGHRKLCSHDLLPSLQSSEGSLPRVEATSKQAVKSIRNSCGSARVPLKSSENIRRRPKGPPTCMLCGAHFEDTRDLARHIIEHSRKSKSDTKRRQLLPMKFVCGMCTPKKVFDSAAQLQNHWKTFHGNTKMGCARCRQNFESANSLRNHVFQCHGAPSGVISGTDSEELVTGPHRFGECTQEKDGGTALEGSDFARLHACSLCDEKFLDAGKLAQHELLDHRVLTPGSSHSHPDTTPIVKDSRQHGDLLREKQNFGPCLSVVVHAAHHGAKPKHLTEALVKDRRIKLDGNTHNAFVSVPVGPASSPEFKYKKGLEVVNGRKTLVLSLQKITKIRGFETRIFENFSMDIISKGGYALFSTSAKIPQRLEKFLVLLEETSDLEGLPEVPPGYNVRSSKKTKPRHSQPVDNARVKGIGPTMAKDQAFVGKHDELLTKKSPAVRSIGFGVSQITKKNTRKQQRSPPFPLKDGTFPCELCWKVFWTKGSLRNHWSRKH